MTDTLNYDKKTVPGTAGLIVSVISYTLSQNPLYNNSKKNYTPLWCVIFCATLYFLLVGSSYILFTEKLHY